MLIVFFFFLFGCSRTPAQSTAIAQLRALTELINQTVGDALSDMLLVETILTHRQWSLKEWDQAYTDLPNRLVKVVVCLRHVLLCDRQEESTWLFIAEDHVFEISF